MSEVMNVWCVLFLCLLSSYGSVTILFNFKIWGLFLVENRIYLVFRVLKSKQFVVLKTKTEIFTPRQFLTKSILYFIFVLIQKYITLKTWYFYQIFVCWNFQDIIWCTFQNNILPNLALFFIRLLLMKLLFVN